MKKNILVKKPTKEIRRIGDQRKYQDQPNLYNQLEY